MYFFAEKKMWVSFANALIFTQVIARKRKYGRADKSIRNRQNLAISYLKPDLRDINAYTKFGENPLIFTCPEMKIRTDG